MIQNINAEALKIAMINLYRYFKTNGFGRIAMNIHDEVVCSVRSDKAEEVSLEVKRIMEEALGYFLDGIPAVSTVKISQFWEKE